MGSNSEATILGVLSLIISVVTLVVLIKSRNNALRESLYNRQLDIFQSLYSHIIDLEVYLREWIPVNEKFNDDNVSDEEFDKVDHDIEKLDDQIEILMNKLDEELSKAQLLLPDEMAEVFDKFMEEFEKVEGTYSEGTLTQAELAIFSREVFELEDSIRRFIGLEKLSKENRKFL